MDFVFIAIGLTLLIFGGNWLLKAAVGFSLRLNIPKIVIIPCRRDTVAGHHAHEQKG